MRVVTPQEMNKVDALMASKYQTPTLVLMEKAADAVATYVSEHYPLTARILIIAGSGNNGGDGFAVARLLCTMGYSVNVLSTADESRMKDAVKENYKKLCELGINNTLSVTVEKLKSELLISDVIIDAILGTGVTGNVNDYVTNIINTVNQAEKEVVSIDVPSGIDATTGKVCGVAIKANALVVLGAMKEGLLYHPARCYYDEYVIDPISIPDSVYEEVAEPKAYYSATEIKSMIKHRSESAHKGDFGKLGIIAGSVGMTGAACLSANAALRSGAGLITLSVPESLNPIFEVKLTEQMTVPVPENKKQALVASSELYGFVDGKTALIIGPGLSRNAEGNVFIPEILKITDSPVVIDADGLNLIVDNIDCLKRGNIVITPHIGEMARLCKKSIDEVKEHQKEIALVFAKEYNVVVCLKSDVTVIASPCGKVVFNVTGNSGMATGGSGDVLSGIIGSLLAQGYEPFNAAVIGTFVNGTAGDVAAEEIGKTSLTPSDTVNALSRVFKALE